MLSRSSFEEAREGLSAAGYVAPDLGRKIAITASGEARLVDLLRRAAQRERESTRALDLTEVEHLRELLRTLVRHNEGET
jgi:hypothetical protein